MKSALPIVKDLVLIGGGHSHAIVLKLFGMNPLPGVRITLISDVDDTPYSGMLPGYIAGLYSFDDCHIDLRPLAQFARVVMVRDRAVGLDLEQRRVICADHPPIAFDLLSIDTGSTPATSTVMGAAEYAVPVKPISQFLQYWDRWMETIAQQPEQPIRLAIVGGGAGGVELTLAAQARLSKFLASAGQPASQLSLHLLHRGDRLIPERTPWVGQRLHKILRQQGVTVHLGETVSQLEPVMMGALAAGTRIHCKSGQTVDCDRVFWVTQAAAAPWLAESGLATDSKGFVLVSDTLQSISHPQVFATGDVATLVNHPRPKAGVFSVRQGQPLYDNLRRVLLDETPQPFIPQREFLILVGTGDRTALASRGRLGIGPYAWLWQWKDRIDRQFMDRFRHLTPHSASMMGDRDLPPTIRPKRSPRSPSKTAPITALSTVPSTAPMLCAGCGSKVGSRVLKQVLRRVQEESGGLERDDIWLGLAAADDAAAVSVPPGQVLLQTVDYFRALVDDPFVFGQIAAHHCLSDLFAMGASPQSALAIATLPDAAPRQLEATLYQLLSGAVQVLTQAGAVLIGGHTTVGAELAFGLTCNGLAAPNQLWRKGGMQPDDILILTKPLGTGTLFAANMQLRAKGRWISSAIESMLVSNQAAADCLRRHQATACTDITGFGLVGHLLEMVQASGVTVEVAIADLPLLNGAADTLAQGFFSSLHPQNLEAAQAIANRDAIARHPLYPLLFDPQTAGGLLASVPAAEAIACLDDLRANGYPHSAIVGQVYALGTAPKPAPIRIR